MQSRNGCRAHSRVGRRSGATPASPHGHDPDGNEDREYDKLCCIVCGKVFDDTNGMYSWPITHGHPTAAVTVVFGCGGAHSREEFDRAASVQFGWMLTPGEFVKTP